MDSIRRYAHWTPALSMWDGDARWNTHLNRIVYAQAFASDGLVIQREKSLDGLRKITWWSILDVECPMCGAGIDRHCETLNIE